MNLKDEFIQRKMIEEKLAHILEDWFDGNYVCEDNDLVIEIKIWKVGKKGKIPIERFTHRIRQ